MLSDLPSAQNAFNAALNTLTTALETPNAATTVQISNIISQAEAHVLLNLGAGSTNSAIQASQALMAQNNSAALMAPAISTLLPAPVHEEPNVTT